MRVRHPRDWSDAAVEWFMVGVLSGTTLLLLTAVACCSNARLTARWSVMAFVRSHTKTIEIPPEPGCTVTIRRPRRGQLRDAADLRQEKALTRVRALGGAAFLQEMRAAQQPASEPTAAPVPETPVADPTPAELAAGFDQDALLAAGLVAWAGPGYDDTPVSAGSSAPGYWKLTVRTST